MLEDFLNIDINTQQLFSPEQAWHYQAIPKKRDADMLEIYADDKINRDLIDELEILFGCAVKIESVTTDMLQNTLHKYYRQSATKETISVSSKHTNDFLAKLIMEARSLGSSDIHIEIYDEKARVRIRIDGMLVERYALNKEDYPALINKIKIRANLDISEKRLPQDGRINFEEGASKIDIRVSILPTLYGEKVVMRLLSNDATNVHIEQLGFSENELSNYLEGIKKPHGILLISGPTGSGKTTTLYATLKILNEEKRNITTIEDPIEYTLDGINQVQLKEGIGLNFAAALKTFLRQDPDVIMLGEIRDAETAQMAIRAALTGHLVLSTIHTNSAWGTISRLTDMGVPPFLLSNTLNTTVAQRLVRLLCKKCKKETEFNSEEFPKHYKAPIIPTTQFKAVGCDTCHFTGYKGRKAIYEVIPIDHELSDQIKKGATSIAKTMQERNIHSLSDNAFELFKNGSTSIEEIYPFLVNH